MKKRHDFEFGKQLVKRLLVIAIIFCAASLFSPKDSYLQLGFMVLALLSMAGELAVLCIYCRCPSCGKRIIFGTLSVTTCPRCHRNLTTGKKSKSRKR